MKPIVLVSIQNLFIIQKLIRLLIDAKISVDLETMPLLSETDELIG
jgi:hypothetical protein